MVVLLRVNEMLAGVAGVQAEPTRSDENMTEHEADRQIAREIMSQLPAAYEVMPADVLVGFITTNRNAKHRRSEVTLQLVANMLEWSASLPFEPFLIEACLTPPKHRAEFERLYQAGPIGHAADGRAVVIERIGAIPPREFCERVTADEMIRQIMFNRQAAFAWNRARSYAHGRLLRQAVVVIDLSGFSTAHLSADFLKLTTTYIGTQETYPEVSTGLYIINAPIIFRAAWKVVSPLLNPVTRDKCKIFGGPASYGPAFEQMGIVTDGPIEDCRPSWVEAVRRLAPTGKISPAFLTPEELDMYQCGMEVAPPE